MDDKEVVAFLGRMEDDFMVKTWKYGDMDIWPIIKSGLFFRWRRQNYLEIEDFMPAKTRSKLDKVYIYFLSFLNYARFRFSKRKAVDVFFCGASSYRVLYQAFFINRYFQPFIDECHPGSFLEIEYNEKQRNKRYKNITRTIFIKNLFRAQRLLNKAKAKKHSLYVPGWEPFILEAEQHLRLPLKNYKTEMIKRIGHIFVYADIFEMLFRKYSPKKVYGLCYYDTPMFAMHFAANKSGIENFDMQHGGQGPLHPMYHFNNMPDKGYNTLPKIFWVWDNASAHNLQHSLARQSFHKITMGGNPWIAYQLRQPDANLSISDKKIILFTNQEPVLDPIIMDAIEQTPPDYQWWIRLHPRMMDTRPAIESALAMRGLLEKVEIDKACAYPLPVLLKKCIILVSKSSGSIIEAVQVGATCIVIDKMGIDNYSEYIASGDAIAFSPNEGLSLFQLISGLNKAS
jgi:hypothetical protein